MQSNFKDSLPALEPTLAVFLVALTPGIGWQVNAAGSAKLLQCRDFNRCGQSMQNDIPDRLRAGVQVHPSRHASVVADSTVGSENGLDESFPWRFEGRLWFRPALVRTPPEPLPGGVNALSLFGWTLGGVVCLEYDVSPVGPYVEYVTMGSLVSKRGTLGQWGSRLFVSTEVAETVCRQVWDVPAEVADLSFADDGETLSVDAAPALVGPRFSGLSGPTQEKIRVGGWAATRSYKDESDGIQYGKVGNLPVLWTPSIKALWAPFVPQASGSDDSQAMPLHRLRLSASSARLHLCGQAQSDELGIPLPAGFSVDGLRIEIARNDGEL